MPAARGRGPRGRADFCRGLLDFPLVSVLSDPLVGPAETRARRAPFRLRGLLVLLALVPAFFPLRPAAAQSAVRFLELEQELVEAQLAQEMQNLRQARSSERGARADVVEAADAVDGALAEEAPLDRVTRFVAELNRARSRLEEASEEADETLDRIVEHRRRLSLVGEELRRRRGGPAEVPDPITGAWRLFLEDSGPERDEARRGLLDLELDGTAVSGTLGLGDGTFGSVRGTFVRGRIELERVSADSGLDLILEGRYDPADGDLEGTWRPAVVGVGNPGGGTWRAEKTELPASE